MNRYDRVVLDQVKKGKIRNLQGGGVVPTPRGYKGVDVKKGDSVPVILQPYELVIPVKHSKMVQQFLKQNNIYLKGMRKAIKK